MFMESKVYKRYAKARAKKSPLIKNCVCAFLIGGLICTAGQALLNLYKYLGITEDNAGTLTSVTLIFITHVMELAVVVADEIFVMRNSNLVERAAFSGDYSVFHDPYSRMLLEASGLVNTSTDWNDKAKERIDLQ